MFISTRLISSCSVQLIKKYKLPPRPKFTVLMENEITESFMHGGRGPGGQKINKSNSKVQLKHLPTGIVIECQETRSREQNRKRVREKMALALDRLINGKEVGTEVLTDRELAMQDWSRQNKKAKQRKSKIKYKEHKESKLQKQQEQLKEEEELIKSMLQD